MKDVVPHRRVIFTGPIDEFFDFRFGKLPYRSLRFRHVTLDKEWHQPVAVVNYPQTHDYTRVTEYKHLTGQAAPEDERSPTSIRRADGDPYYPIPKPENAGAVQEATSASALRDAGRVVRRAAGDLSLLQHGPDRRPGARHLPPHQRGAAGGRGDLARPRDEVRRGTCVLTVRASATAEKPALARGGMQRQALPKRSQLGRLRDPDAFWWATGIEDTFITAPWHRHRPDAR